MTLLAPIHETPAVVEQFAAVDQKKAKLDLPSYGSSAISAVGYTDILATSGSTKPRAIASINKIITALVVLDAKPLTTSNAGPKITFTAADEGFYSAALALNGSVEPVRAGLVLTQKQVMQVMLVASANNYAISLATWAFGSQNAYVAKANAWLAKNGLKHTSIVDATGLSPRDTSTASDLVRLGKLAIANPVIAKITATKKVTVPGVGEILNTNKLLGIAGVHGIKTGTLDAAGACLLFAADYAVGASTVTVVGVVLGAVDHDVLDADIRSLLKTVVPGFHEQTLAKAGDSFARYSTPWGDSTDAVAAIDAKVVTWSDTPVSAVISTRDVALSPEGASVGQVTFTAGEQKIVVPLTLTRPIDDPGMWWRLSHPVELF
jgi:serine-type D-Ala-D-Ala carboxypeptidase (penicillin-binding protein 5/6)